MKQAKWKDINKKLNQPAAFGRLCVETFHERTFFDKYGPAAFGRLCVETGREWAKQPIDGSSRLRAAVC